MNEFISKFESQISGTLAGYDRLLVCGHLPLTHDRGMRGYLWANDLGLKDFGNHAETISKRVREACEDGFQSSGRPVEYLRSGKIDKQELARSIAQRDGITAGPICALTAVEMCRTYRVCGDRATKKIKLEAIWRKCLMIYQYSVHPVFGFMSTRLQTWFPFPITIYLNGREWLAQQMEQAQLRYRRHKNCFTWVEDFSRAQALLDEQLKTEWEPLLSNLLTITHPLFPELCRNYPMSYYWSCPESEWAMDIVFRKAEDLRRLYPRLVQLGITAFSSVDVLRFFGKRATTEGASLGRSEVPISSDIKVRSIGTRLKHRLGPNSLKIYDKAYDELGAVLRPEVTINRPEIFRVYRTKNNEPEGKKSWRAMRRGVVDLGRRAEACQKALDVYCSALASVNDDVSLEELISSIERPVRIQGRSYRALHPFEARDLALLRIVNRGEFAINGLKNRDLQDLLYDSPAKNKSEQRRRSAALSRKLKLLRVHGIIRKLPHTHRYRVTDNGRKLLNAILSAQRITLGQILAVA